VNCSGCNSIVPNEARFCPKCGKIQKEIKSDTRLGLKFDDRYLILESIGEGGSGKVYLGTNIRLGKRVAIKILHSELAENEKAVEKFRKEATSVTELENAHIIKVYDFGKTNNNLMYTVMEYLPGETLSSRLAKTSFLTYYKTMDIVEQICDGLSEAHALGFVHRDLRPRNIILTEKAGKKDFVKILDFGLAKIVTIDDPSKSGIGLNLGDPTYTAPEQMRNKDVDSRADIYSLAIMAYQMLCGHAPYTGNTIFEIMGQHFDAPYPPLEGCIQDLPQGIDQIFEKALSKDPNHRFNTVFQFKDAFELLKEAPVAPQNPNFKNKKSNSYLNLQPIKNSGETPAIVRMAGGGVIRVSKEMNVLKNDNYIHPNQTLLNYTPDLPAKTSVKKTSLKKTLLMGNNSDLKEEKEELKPELQVTNIINRGKLTRSSSTNKHPIVSQEPASGIIDEPVFKKPEIVNKQIIHEPEIVNKQIIHEPQIVNKQIIHEPQIVNKQVIHEPQIVNEKNQAQSGKIENRNNLNGDKKNKRGNVIIGLKAPNVPKTPKDHKHDRDVMIGLHPPKIDTKLGKQLNLPKNFSSSNNDEKPKKIVQDVIIGLHPPKIDTNLGKKLNLPKNFSSSNNDENNNNHESNDFDRNSNDKDQTNDFTKKSVHDEIKNSDVRLKKQSDDFSHESSLVSAASSETFIKKQNILISDIKEKKKKETIFWVVIIGGGILITFLLYWGISSIMKDDKMPDYEKSHTKKSKLTNNSSNINKNDIKKDDVNKNDIKKDDIKKDKPEKDLKIIKSLDSTEQKTDETKNPKNKIKTEKIVKIKKVISMDSMKKIKTMVSDTMKIVMKTMDVKTKPVSKTKEKFKKARALMSQGNFSGAAKIFNEILKSSPRNYSALMGLAESSFESGNTKKAEAALLKAVKIRGTARTWYKLGSTQQKLGKTGSAKSSYKKSLQINSNYKPAIKALAKLEGK
jgi:serine/threonine protein kinase